MANAAVEPIGWERALMAAEKVKERLRGAVRALGAAGVPYAVVVGNAVAEWVARVDEDAVRNTRDVDIMIRRPDFAAAKACLEAAGFIHILDLIGVGLIDATWPARFPAPLGDRLQQLLDNPNG